MILCGRSKSKSRCGCDAEDARHPPHLLSSHLFFFFLCITLLCITLSCISLLCMTLTGLTSASAGGEKAISQSPQSIDPSSDSSSSGSFLSNSTSTSSSSSGSSSSGSSSLPVLALELSGPITPASDDIAKAAFDLAGSGGYSAVMLTLDTPGGGLVETYEIFRLMEA